MKSVAAISDAWQQAGVGVDQVIVPLQRQKAQNPHRAEIDSSGNAHRHASPPHMKPPAPRGDAD